VVLAAEAAQLGGRHVDVCAGGQLLHERFPGANVAGVIAGGKLRDP
jgi:hypothetical protein